MHDVFSHLELLHATWKAVFKKSIIGAVYGCAVRMCKQTGSAFLTFSSGISDTAKRVPKKPCVCGSQPSPHEIAITCCPLHLWMQHFKLKTPVITNMHHKLPKTMNSLFTAKTMLLLRIWCIFNINIWTSTSQCWEIQSILPFDLSEIEYASDSFCTSGRLFVWKQALHYCVCADVPFCIFPMNATPEICNKCFQTLVRLTRSLNRGRLSRWGQIPNAHCGAALLVLRHFMLVVEASFAFIFPAHLIWFFSIDSFYSQRAIE